MSKIIIALARAKDSPFYGLLASMYNQIEQRDSANESYLRIKVVLDNLLDRGYAFESPEIQAIVEMLRELPAPFACARNFERLYLRDEYTLRKLPDDPKKIPKGHWH